MRNYFKGMLSLAITLLFITFTHSTSAQVTTATLSGIVRDPKGVALSAATVTVEYPDAGIKQTIITKSDGRFTVPNLRVLCKAV